MLYTLLGLCILFIPFIMVFWVQDKKRAFLYIFLGFVSFTLLTSLITQLLDIFTYPVILTSYIVFDVFCVFVFLKNNTRYSFNLKINPLFATIFILVCWNLYSIHYRYDGPVSTVNGTVQNTTATSYGYPLFSDEWVGAGLMRYAIENHSLPHINPLYHNSNFINPLIVFFSFFAQIFLVLHLDPITHYAIGSIICGALTVLLIYIYLRVPGIGIYSATFSMVASLYIINTGNMPGLWFLLPVNVGLLFLLSALISFAIKDKILFFTSSVLSFLFYPPIVVFIIPLLVFYLYQRRKKIKLKTIFYISASMISSLVLLGYIIIQKLNVVEIYNLYASKLIRANLDIGIPVFYPWIILPVTVIVLSVIGIKYVIYKKDYFLLIPACTGIVFWLFYNFYPHVFIIEYPRVVYITSILLILLCGIGLDYVIKKIQDHPRYSKAFVFGILIFAVGTIMYYPEILSARWDDTSLRINEKGRILEIEPSLPITRHIIQDDIFLFQNIKNQNFIAPPWKGLAVGIATHNYPLESKTSIISNKLLNYKTFIDADCETKRLLAQTYAIAYVYSSAFDCPNFTLMGSSVERLYLYRVE